MASSSSISSIQKTFKYDVFLSFRGEDTRKNFVDHLYAALQCQGIDTYKDDEKIKQGKRIDNELIESIEDSNFFIIVFSKNYASSSWCLNELVKIMECHKTREQMAYPVFYDVEPSEVRKQHGLFGDAFSKHKNEESVGKWREALEEAANLAGWELKNFDNGHEAKLIQKIVEEISLELRSINSGVDEKLVGMETRMKHIISIVEAGSDEVRMIGIKGMGGVGKTTLARAIFDKICNQFDGYSFVENVREVSKNSLLGLKWLQQQVLSDVLTDQKLSINSVTQGKNLLKRRLWGRRVVVVLDDVDHIDQLEALAGAPNWFKPGSMIVITTRDEQVLVAHRVKWICDINLLSDDEAICLFSRYSFGREVPVEGYEELSAKVIHYADGLPLTIKVLGSFLCGKDRLEWIDALERLKTIPLQETLEKLELSYTGLEKDYKEIFLDVACLLKGWHKDRAIMLLESCGFHARNGLRVLEQKSLITISNYGDLDMHDHIEEMGMNIVRREHPNEPRKCSRLWIQHEIEDILANNLVRFNLSVVRIACATSFMLAILELQGTEATRCIKLELNSEIAMEGLVNMKKLRCLIVETNFEESDFRSYVPSELQYLSWHDYNKPSLPKIYGANDLVGLEMCYTGIGQLWEVREKKVLNKLKFIDLTGSENLRTFDLGLNPNLEKLVLKGCCNLVELQMPSPCLNLKSLEITESKLRTLDLRQSPYLEKLVVEKCHDFVELQIPSPCLNLTSLELIDLGKLRTLYFGATPDLDKLHLKYCFDLVELHMPIECPKLSLLKVIDSNLKTLDLRLTPNLESLYLRTCVDSVEFHMPVESLKLRSLELIDSKLRTLDLGLTPNLESLSLAFCDDLVELHMPIECPKLESVNLSYSKLKTFDLSLTPNLKTLVVRDCDDMAEIHMPVKGCTTVTSLFLHNYPLDVKDPPPAKHFKTSSHFRILAIVGDVLKIPRIFDQLECLEELHMFYINIKHLPDSICMLKHLKILQLDNCWLLEKLPEDLDQFEWLEKLSLMCCTSLVDIPNSVCNMRHLNYINLPDCKQVVKLPEELGRLECLQELNVQGTSITHLPKTISLLKGLRVVGSTSLLQSCGFATEIQTSGTETFCYISSQDNCGSSEATQKDVVVEGSR